MFRTTAANGKPKNTNAARWDKEGSDSLGMKPVGSWEKMDLESVAKDMVEPRET
jgi:hypothetical protein